MESSDYSFPSFSTFPTHEPKPLQVEYKKATKRRKRHKAEHIEQEFDMEFQSLDYYIDKKGDDGNVKYQSIRNQPIPDYKRSSTKIVGSNDCKLSDVKKLEILLIEPISKQSEYQNRINYKEFRKTIAEYHIIMREDQKAVPNINDDYIPLPELNFESKEYSNHFQEEFQRACAELDKQIRKAPKEPANWIRLVYLQDRLLLNSLDQSSTSILNQIHSKKLAILERALEDLSDVEELVEIYVDLLQEIKESKEMLAIWDGVLQYHPYSFKLWKKYLDYRCTDASSFNFDTILQLHSQFLNRLIDSPSIDMQELLHIFARLCLFLKQTGYAERAIACYQAIIEFNCFLPSDLKHSSVHQKLEKFQEFWDSECPRFGESGAVGWKNSLEKRIEHEGFLSKLETELEQFDDVKDRYERWLLKENYASRIQWAPIRNVVQETFDDPFTQVLFDDIKPFLFEIGASDQLQLVSLFLEFLGIPFHFNRSSTAEMNQDNFLFDSLVNTSFRDHFLQEEATVSIQCPMYHYPIHANSFYGEDEFWPYILGHNHISVLEEYRSCRIDFILQVLEQSKVLLPNAEKFDLYILWIQFLKDPKKYMMFHVVPKRKQREF
jgi:hypothetical protein